MDANLQLLHEISLKLSEHEETVLNSIKSHIAGFFLTCPFPAWIKLYPSFEMLYINPAYENEYGISLNEYRKSFDRDVWGAAESKNFHKNDQAAAETRQPVQAEEPVYNSESNQEELLQVVKWPIISSGAIIGIAGMVTQSDKSQGDSTK